MSGGIAYVYDVNDQFAGVCNTEMVDLDPVGDDDITVLQEMLAKHHQYTGSTIAGFILQDLANQVKHFVKVFPRDYKKVLQQVSNKQTAQL